MSPSHLSGILLLELAPRATRRLPGFIGPVPPPLLIRALYEFVVILSYHPDAVNAAPAANQPSVGTVPETAAHNEKSTRNVRRYRP